MQGIGEFFRDVWQMPLARVVIGLTVIAILVVTLIYVVKRFRGMALGQENSSMLDHLNEFRRMRDDGQIDEKDFKRVKSELSKQALDETISGGEATEIAPSVSPHRRLDESAFSAED